MGADGGITWVKVKDKKAFFALMKPFWAVTRHDDYHDVEHDAYLAKHPLPSDCLIATYGTDHDLSGYDTLRDMLQEVPSLEECYDVHKDATFIEILESEYTLPSWRAAQGGAILHALLGGRHYGGYYYRDHPDLRAKALLNAIERGKDDPVLVMRVTSWAKHITDLIYPNSFGSAETWT